MTHRDAELRRFIMDSIISLRNIELTGYMLGDDNGYELVNPDYSKEKETLMKMLHDISEREL